MSPPASRTLTSTELRRRSLPLQEQLYERVRSAIAAGRINPGERLPASRTLASELGVARGTVEAAYARLAGEGYLLARGAGGTIVSPMLRLDALPPHRGRARAPIHSERVRIRDPLPFQMGLPALDMFPRPLWARLTARAARRLTGAALAYPDPAGLPRLREAIATYLAVSRGVLCEPEQVVITGGYQTAISMLARLLLGSRDSVWLEDPGYFLARQALQVVSKHLVPVPVDDEGIRVDLAVTRAPGARVAVVTPAHQSPLGVALALNRRQKLLAWATASDAWIIEDDYDGEFHYVGRKLPALKSLDTADRVIYAGSFSKTLFPSLRLGYIVVPMSLLRNVIDTMCATHHGMQALGQMVAADFIAEGHFARHLKRMRGLYAARREALASALVESFGNRIKLVLQPGGMHLIVRFCDRIVDTELVRRSLAHRLAPTALSTHYIGRMRDHGLLLSFTNIPEAQAARYAKALLQAVA